MTFYVHPNKCAVCGKPRHGKGVDHSKCSRELQRKYEPVKVEKKKR